jgi:hypothetical protein
MPGQRSTSATDSRAASGRRSRTPACSSASCCSSARLRLASRGAVVEGSRLSRQSTLPRLRRAGNQLAQGRLDEAHLLGDAEVHVEVARIDRAQLEVQHAAADLAHLHGIAGHAVDHL